MERVWRFIVGICLWCHYRSIIIQKYGSLRNFVLGIQEVLTFHLNDSFGDMFFNSEHQGRFMVNINMNGGACQKGHHNFSSGNDASL